MKHRSSMEKRFEISRIQLSEDMRNYQDSKPEHRDPKAYKKFKTPPTDYGSGRKCDYGEKTECVIQVVYFGILASRADTERRLSYE